MDRSPAGPDGRGPSRDAPCVRLAAFAADSQGALGCVSVFRLRLAPWARCKYNVAVEPVERHIRLAPPGAGLPWYQALVGRRVLLPLMCRTHSWERARRSFLREGKCVLALADSLSVDDLATCVLVRGVIGIEDSSRYWSVALTIEHLIIVGDQMLRIAVALYRNEEPPVRVDIAAVKPPGALQPSDVVNSYGEFLDRFDAAAGQVAGAAPSNRRLDHPWFGRIDAHQWCCLAAMHQRIHRRQIQAIMRGLPRI